jgi:hypothetical protein
MHTNNDRPEELTDLERRLQAWRPAEGPNADAILFAAGKASVRPPPTIRFPWPALAAGLALLAVALGFWAISERNERYAVLARVPEPSRVQPPPTLTDVAPTEQNPNSYLTLTTRARSQDVDTLVAYHSPTNRPDTPSSPASPILRPWGGDLFREP